jgi:hypothetical protein
MKAYRNPAWRRRFRSSLARSLATVALVALPLWPATAGTLLISNGSPVQILVPTNDIGPAWQGLGFDDSQWLPGTSGVGYESLPTEFGLLSFADSVAEWSTAGKHGENNWINGFYDKTADADGTYQVGDFQPFRRSDNPWSTSNYWDGTAWNWSPNDVPWTTIGQTDIHPNGANSGGVEQWAIRRWRSTIAGPVTLKLHLRKTNLNGTGVTGKIFQNGAELFSQTIAGNDGTGFTVLVPASVNVGDYLDFVQTPLGSDGDSGDGADGSAMTAQVTQSAEVPPLAITDTVNGWGTGAQGENGWYYGYWNKTADGDGTYTPTTDFNYTDPNWHLSGANWVLGAGGQAPWDSIGQTDWHPNGDNNAAIHWVIKRWTSNTDGDIYCRVQFAKGNTGCGNGTTLHVFHNGVEKFSRTITGGDGTGFDTFVVIKDVVAGDAIEFALDPLGTDGSYADGCDGSRLTATIYPGSVPYVPSLRPFIATDIQTQMQGVCASAYLRFPFTVASLADIQDLKLRLKWNDGYLLYLNGALVDKKNAPTVIVSVPIADSIADWSSTGVQGANGWYNGYYDRKGDADQTFQVGDVTLFPHDGLGHSPTDFWNGSGWDWYNGNPPWTELYQEGTHPNFDATYEHWTVRRWAATQDGNLKCRFKFRKSPTATCGDGVTGYVFKNGTMVYSNSIAATDSVGRDDIVDLPDVLAGDFIDIMLSPGPGNDFCDGSFFSATIFTGDPITPWDAAATARRAAGKSSVSDMIDLSGFIPQLVAGANILAIQGLNVSSNDTDFLILPELIASRPPTAANDNAVAARGATTPLSKAFLLANDSDPGGASVMVVGAGLAGQSAAGATVQLRGETVYYTPVQLGADSFSYTIADSTGTPVSALVNMFVTGLAGISVLPEGGFSITAVGEPGASYRLERTESLTTPSWTTVDGPIVAEAPDGLLKFKDTNPPRTQAFYQTVKQE